MKPRCWLNSEAKQHKKILITVLLFGLLSGVSTIIFSGCVAYIIYALFILRHTLFELSNVFLLLISCIVLRAFFVFIKEACGTKISILVRGSLRERFMQKLCCLGPQPQKQFSSAQLSTMAWEQIEELNDYYAYYLPQVYLVVLVPMLVLSVVFYFNWLAGIILLISAPLVVLFMALIGMGAKSANEKNFQALSRMSTVFLDLLQGLNTLKLFNASQRKVSDVKFFSNAFRVETMKVLRIAFMSSAVLEFFSAISIALVAMMLGLSLLGYVKFGFYGQINLFSALFVLLLSPEFFLPLRELGVQYHAKAKALAAAEKLVEIFAIPTHEGAIDTKKVNQWLPVDIEFDSVSFSYEPAQSELTTGFAENEKRVVLDKISFKVSPNQPLYIVGESGAGKTTILQLMLGLLTPDSGVIKSNGVDISTLSRQNWMSNLSWVGQNPKLFSGSIRDNLLMARQAINEADLFSVLRSLGLDEFIASLPEGLDTVIGEQGLSLSGGQIQRLALARALLKNAPILLLDEPTAGLDRASEKIVLKAIEAFGSYRTVVMVTHRLDNIPANAFIFKLTEHSGQLMSVQS